VRAARGIGHRIAARARLAPAAACLGCVVLLGGAAAVAEGAPLFTASYLSFDTAARPFAVATGDVDGDGIPDLASANQSGDNVSVLIGNGDGTFQARRDYATGIGPIGVTIADLDDDGMPDLVVANLSSNTVSVLINNGDGTFAPKVDYAMGNSPFAVVVRDMNLDGHRDLIVTNERSNTVSVLFGTGGGHLGRGTTTRSASTPSRSPSAT